MAKKKETPKPKPSKAICKMAGHELRVKKSSSAGKVLNKCK